MEDKLGDSKSPKAPTRIEIEQKLVDLIAGRITPDEVSAWARRGTAYESPVDDPVVEDILERLYVADMPSTDRKYLFGLDDFSEWLRILRAHAITEERPN